MPTAIIRTCQGCGKEMTTFKLKLHEQPCKRAQVRPGDRFHILYDSSETAPKGSPRRIQRIRKNVGVEVVKSTGDGWTVRRADNDKQLFATSRRFTDWADFAPGLQRGREIKKVKQVLMYA